MYNAPIATTKRAAIIRRPLNTLKDANFIMLYNKSNIPFRFSIKYLHKIIPFQVYLNDVTDIESAVRALS